MFDISFGEMLLVGVIALLVLGPERLPGAVREVAKWIGKARATVRAANDELQRELSISELQQELKAEPVANHDKERTS